MKKKIFIFAVLLTTVFLSLFACANQVQDIDDDFFNEDEFDNLVEISCDVITKISYGKYYDEKYTTLGFYIDDKNEELYFAPSKKLCINTSKVFEDNYIALYGVPYVDGMGGSININRNSGTIDMNFRSKNGYKRVIYTGRCSKVSNKNKF